MSRFGGARFVLSAADPRQFPPDTGVEVAFAGRSNSGKSSAINSIVHHHGLARTSRTPGRTRLLNFFEMAPGRRLVDLPGYGYAEVRAQERQAWLPMLESLRRRTCLRGLFVIVDARRGLSQGDEDLLAWAQPAHQVHILLSKSDKLNRSESSSVLRSVAAALGPRASVQLFSALKGTGVREAQDVLAAWLGV